MMMANIEYWKMNASANQSIMSETMGQAGLKDGVFDLMLHAFVLPHPYLALYDRDGKFFLVPSQLFGGPRSLTSPCKTIIFINLLHNYYNFFFSKTCFINKNIIEITTKFLSHQINLIFSKNLIILSKCSIR